MRRRTWKESSPDVVWALGTMVWYRVLANRGHLFIFLLFWTLCPSLAAPAVATGPPETSPTSESPSGQQANKIPNHRTPGEEISVRPEAAAPAWRLIWEKARQMGRQGEVDGAVALYLALLEDRPGLLEARWELAQLLVQVDRRQDAVRELERYVEARPEDPKALIMLADLLAELGQWSRAIPFYERRIDLARNSEEFMVQGGDEIEFRMAGCLSALGRDQEALRHLQAAYEARPDRADLALKIADVLRQLGRQREALPYLAKLAPHYAGDPVFLERYARTLLDVGKWEQAVPVLRDVVELGAGVSAEQRQWARLELIRLYIMDGQAETAVETLESWVLEDLDPALKLRLARLYFAQERYLDALKVFEGLLRQKPEDQEALSFVARIYERLYLWVPAVEAYRRLLKVDPRPDVRSHLVGLLIKRGLYVEAGALLDRDLVKVWEGDEEGLRLLLDLYDGQGRLQEAQQILEVMRQRFPESQELAAKAVSLCLVQKNEGEAAAKMLAQAAGALVGQGERWWPMLQVVVEELRGRGQGHLAVELVSRCWREDRALWAGVTWLKLVRKTEGREKAVELGQELLGEEPQDHRMRLFVAGLFAEHGQPQDVQVVIAPLEGLGSWEEEQLQLWRAWAARVSGRYEDALAATHALLEGAPNHLEARMERWKIFRAYGFWPETAAEAMGISFLRGIMLAGNGEPMVYLGGVELPAPGRWMVVSPAGDRLPDPAALIALSRGLGPNDAVGLLLPLAYESHGYWREAEAAWRVFVRRHPRHWPAQERLIYVLAANDKKAEAAEVMATASGRLSQVSGLQGGVLVQEMSRANNGAAAPDLARLWNTWQNDSSRTLQELPSDGEAVWLPGAETWETLEALALATWSRRLTLR